MYIEGTLKWVGTLDIYRKYSKAERQPFPCPQQIKNACGFVKTYENFSMFRIMNAGHVVSYIISFLIPNIHMINLRHYRSNIKRFFFKSRSMEFCFIQDKLLETLLKSKLYTFAMMNRIKPAL